MWLLDANMDVHLVGLLAEFGISCETAKSRGWGSLSNGDLIAVAIEAGFTTIVTQDKLFAESGKQALRTAPGKAIVVVRLPQRPWREYIQQFRDAWAKRPLEPIPGEVVYWPKPDD